MKSPAVPSLLLLTGIGCGCAASAPDKVDPCLEYNQGMRVTRNTEWPAAVNEAEDLLSKMQLASMRVVTRGPDEYDRLAEEYSAVLKPATKSAESCYEDSLFQSIVVRMTETRSKYDQSADRGRVHWRAKEERRMARQVAVAELPADLKTIRLGDAEVRITSIQSNPTTIGLELKNLSTGRIIKARTARLWGYDAESPELGGIAPTGFSLFDNFGNTFSLASTNPEQTGAGDAGLHPTRSQEYEIKFFGYPPEAASTVTLAIWPGTFGNSEQYAFVLPRRVFLP